MINEEFQKKILGYDDKLKKIYRESIAKKENSVEKINEFLETIETDDLCALHYFLNVVSLKWLEDNAYDSKYFEENRNLVALIGNAIDERPDFQKKKSK